MTAKETEKEIVWRAREIDYQERDPSWYWLVGTVSVVLVLVALWQKNFFFAVFIILAGMLLLIFGRRKPQVVEFKITSEGVHVGRNRFHEFSSLQGFAIEERPGRLHLLILKRKAGLDPYTKIPLDGRLAPKVEKFLEENLERIEYKGSLIDIITDLFGF